MSGSIYCIKWRWNNCPTVLHGHYKGKEKEPAVTLKAITNQSLWIWHALSGTLGCLNDNNVAEASSLSEMITFG